MISREHMPICPYCANVMRDPAGGGAPCEIIVEFGLIGLAHSRCIARETRRAPNAAPPATAEQAHIQPEQVG